MPTASRSGSRKASRLNWRTSVRSLSRPGPRGRAWPRPFTGLVAAMSALIRFHEAHPEWFPPVSKGNAAPQPATMDPEWNAAIEKAYRTVPGSTDVSPASLSPAISGAGLGCDVETPSPKC